MIVRQVNLPAYKSGQVYRVRPMADWHFGSVNCDVKAIKRWLDEDKDAYFVGLGDLMDMVIAGDAKRYRKSGDALPGDDVVDQQIESVYDMLSPHKSRIWGLGDGNHEDSITKYHGTNPTKRLAAMLDVPYLGYSWLLRLSMAHKSGGGGRKILLRGHHGWGGGSRTQGADLTKYARDMQYWDADIWLYGHVHRKQTDRIPRMSLVGTKLVSRPKLLCLCGTFLRTYGDGTAPSYSEIKGYPPVDIGGVVLNVKPSSTSGSPHGKPIDYWVDL